MTIQQQFISNYLLAEFYHTLGDYSSAEQFFDKLSTELDIVNNDVSRNNNKIYVGTIGSSEEDNINILKRNKHYNRLLKNEIFATRTIDPESSNPTGWKEYRHPLPDIFSTDDANNYSEFEKRFNNYAETISDYYSICALCLKGQDSEKKTRNFLLFNTTIPSRYICDRQALHRRRNQVDNKNRVEIKKLRYQRLDQSLHALVSGNSKDRIEKKSKESSELKIGAQGLLNCNLSSRFNNNNTNDYFDWINKLPHTILDMFDDMHFMLHYIDHIKSFHYGHEHSRNNDTLINDILVRAIAIYTFIFDITQSMPWVFAADSIEGEYIQNFINTNSIGQLPPRCMWINVKLTLLSLYRRASCLKLKGTSHYSQAFNDFNKSLILSRAARRIQDRLATPIQNSRIWLTAMGGICEYRMGELYRVDHAHMRAFKHFCHGYDQLTELAQIKETKSILENSSIYIKLMINKGKAFYELGSFKRALKWHLKAWKALTQISATDSVLDINSRATDSLITWLERIRNDSMFSKYELIQLARPFVDDVVSTRVLFRLQGLAADILNRIGHTLFTLKLDSEDKSGNINATSTQLHALAKDILIAAYFNDSCNTLIKSNLVRINNSTEYADVKEKIRKMEDIDKKETNCNNPLHYPCAKTDFEKFSRVYEYYLMRDVSRNSTHEDTEEVTKYAKSIMLSFLANTDSFNVRQAQVYKYLTTKKTDGIDLAQDSGDIMKPIIEFICLRRYSSFFPFLPRPTSFQVLGGGYFLRLYNQSIYADNKGYPLGVVIDPGPNFIENLYQVGYSLADIDIIIVTHDHTDHISSLDPLLSLIQYRSSYFDSNFLGRDNSKNGSENILKKPLLIIGNDSVFTRYEQLNTIFEDNEQKNIKYPAFQYVVPFSVFENADELTKFESNTIIKYIGHLEELGIRITSLTNEHRDILGNHAKSFKIALSKDNSPSISFTSDTGGFKIKKKCGDADSYNIENTEENFEAHWKPLLNSDVFIPHVSCAPFAQLKLLAGLGYSTKNENQQWSNETKWLSDLYSKTCKNNELEEQIKFAFWLDDECKSLFEKGNLPDNQGSHMYIEGLFKFAQSYDIERSNKNSLLIVSELREELTTYRSKIATALNNGLFKSNSIHSLTADIGLHILIEKIGDDKSDIKVLCNTCELDNDYINIERYHSPEDITEVCIKGENEGIFYNCNHHDTGSNAEPHFLERLERYNIYGRTEF